MNYKTNYKTKNKFANSHVALRICNDLTGIQLMILDTLTSYLPEDLHEKNIDRYLFKTNSENHTILCFNGRHNLSDHEFLKLRMGILNVVSFKNFVKSLIAFNKKMNLNIRNECDSIC